MPISIVSGGQTGADRGALDAALASGVPCGGYCPRGRRAEDGPIAPHYPLVETESADYAVRTERNVVESDATVTFTYGPATGGTKLTALLARRHQRPLLEVDLAATAESAATAAVTTFVRDVGAERLNVAGSRESKSPGLAAAVERVLTATLAALAQGG